MDSNKSHDIRSNGLRQGTLGVWFIVFFVVSAAGPLTVIAGGLPMGMMLGNGAGLPFMLILVIIVLLLFSVGYTSMSRHVANGGGFYALISRGLGFRMGGIAASLAILGYNAMQIGLYGLHGVASAALLRSLTGISCPWWVWAYASIITIGFLGYRRVDLSARLLMTLVACEYLVVLIFDFLIVHAGGNSGLSMAPFTFSALLGGAPAIAVLFCFAAFVGFEATTIYSEEAKNPTKTIPIATYVSILLIGGFYTFSAWCLVVGAGYNNLASKIISLSDPTDFTFILANQYGSAWLSIAMRIMLVTSVYAALLAFHNSIARYFFSTGREGFLPRKLGEAHLYYQSPHTGSLLQSVIAITILTCFVLCRSDPINTVFSWLTNLATLCIICLMTICSLSITRFFYCNKNNGINNSIILFSSILSGIVFLIIFILSVDKFHLLTGQSGQIAWTLLSLLPLAVLAGLLRANYLLRYSPNIDNIL